MSESIKPLSEEDQIVRHQALTKNNNTLRERLIRLQTEQAGLKNNYEREVKETEAEFGTSDVQELRDKYAAERQEGSDDILNGEAEHTELEELLDAIEAKREEHGQKA